MKNKKMYLTLSYVVFLIVITTLISFLADYNLIKMDPLTTGEAFLASMPYVQVGSLIWQQPSSRVFIFGLGIFIVVFGVKMLKVKEKHLSRKWWGVSMIFWGVSAIFAGISYQAFGYQLKCVGNTYANFTDWFEIMYLLFTGTSICLLVFGMSYCTAVGKARKECKRSL